MPPSTRVERTAALGVESTLAGVWLERMVAGEAQSTTVRVGSMLVPILREIEEEGISDAGCLRFA